MIKARRVFDWFTFVIGANTSKFSSPGTRKTCWAVDQHVCSPRQRYARWPLGTSATEARVRRQLRDWALRRHVLCRIEDAADAGGSRACGRICPPVTATAVSTDMPGRASSALGSRA